MYRSLAIYRDSDRTFLAVDFDKKLRSTWSEDAKTAVKSLYTDTPSRPSLDTSDYFTDTGLNPHRTIGLNMVEVTEDYIPKGVRVYAKNQGSTIYSYVAVNWYEGTRSFWLSDPHRAFNDANTLEIENTIHWYDPTSNMFLPFNENVTDITDQVTPAPTPLPTGLRVYRDKNDDLLPYIAINWEEQIRSSWHHTPEKAALYLSLYGPDVFSQSLYTNPRHAHTYIPGNPDRFEDVTHEVLPDHKPTQNETDPTPVTKPATNHLGITVYRDTDDGTYIAYGHGKVGMFAHSVLESLVQLINNQGPVSEFCEEYQNPDTVESFEPVNLPELADTPTNLLAVLLVQWAYCSLVISDRFTIRIDNLDIEINPVVDGGTKFSL